MIIKQRMAVLTRPLDDEDRMRRMLARMSVISEASAQQFGDVIHGGSDPSRPPKGPRVSMAEYHARAWRRARTSKAREEAIEDARAALSNAKYAPRRTDTPGTVEWRLAIANDPRRVEDVAQSFGVSVRHVYTMRKISGARDRRRAA